MAADKKSPVTAIVLVVIIALALVLVIKNAMPKKYSYNADLKCEICNEISQAKVFSGQKTPYKCGACGKKAAYRALRCMKCGEVSIHKPVEITEDMSDDQMMEIDMPKCSKCGSMDLGSVTPLVPAK